MTRARLVILSALLLPFQAAAFEKLDGWFVALESCEAMQSKNKGTNPGEVMTEARRAYAIIGINEAGGDHYQIRVPGAPVTEERWVRTDCGVHEATAGMPPPDAPAPPLASSALGRESADNLLALNWQPAFCETAPGAAECRRLNAGKLPGAEAQLSIHGLWPEPNGRFYCGVADEVVRLDQSGRWSELPEPSVDAATRAALDTAMPGTASFLDRHEWIKHGTCHLGAGGADEYFDDALRLTAELNGSAVGRFLAENVGNEVSTEEIAGLFDQAFGEGAGDRVEFACIRDRGRTLIQELRIALRGVIGPGTSLGELMLAAQPVHRGCARGTIDPAGLQ